MAFQPLVSCIVPVFNGERYLTETLASVVAQTYRSYEIIVVDDGSTDQTSQVVRNYGCEINYAHQQNAGPAAARNHGIRLAKGDLIAFLDADDLWVPHKLALQVSRFDTRSDLAMSLTYVRNFWSPELENAPTLDKEKYTEPWPAHNNTNALLVKRNVFETVGLFDTSCRIADDVDWFVRAVQHGVVKELLPDITVHRRLHNGNISRRFATQTKIEMLDIVQKLMKSRAVVNG